MAGIVAAEYLGYIGKEELNTELADLEKALDGLRQGMFAPKNRGKAIEKTEEGIEISKNLLLAKIINTCPRQDAARQYLRSKANFWLGIKLFFHYLWIR